MTPPRNQHPEQLARDRIDAMLAECGWAVQDYKRLNLAAATGVAVREFPTQAGPADYALFVDRKAVGIIEAKRIEEGANMSAHEEQVEDYARAKLRHIDHQPLPFAYLSTGQITRFADARDPKPRFREVFAFHRPETLARWLRKPKSLRAALHSDLPPLDPAGLRSCQIEAITSLEASFAAAKPKALVQMATGSGKTFTAITAVYRLLKFARAERVLFLVDTRNLGEQAEGEFRKFLPQDDNRLFPELYGVTRLSSRYIPPDSQVYISTIQRLYSILKGTELDESAEDENPAEHSSFAREALPVVYNERLPVEFFDFIVIDECHRSIYNLWKQVLDYFDAIQIGLTATPDSRTFGYFNQNIVSDYGYEKAVIDGVLVPYNVYTIETRISKEGATIRMGELVDKRERLTRRRFWEAVDEEVTYTARQLDKDVVNPSTIRTIVREVKRQLPAMFPDRFDPATGAFEVPKLLIFAKTDSHAEDIIEIVREEFGEGNEFCKKITYQSKEDPKTVLSRFRNDYYPRIAVTVDMIATGTDIRPLEVLLFMRDVKSRSYYEQMKGRGTRTCPLDELRSKCSPSAKFAKDHFVIIDAVGVEQSLKTDSRPLEKAPGVPLKEVLLRIAVGDRSEEMLSTLAHRLLRLDKQLDEREQARFAEKAGLTLPQVARALLSAHDPDVVAGIHDAVRREMPGQAPLDIGREAEARHQQLLEAAVACFHDPDVREYLLDVRRKYDQIIDGVNLDTLSSSAWVTDQQARAEALVSDFRAWIEAHRDSITALQVFYGQPYRRRELTYRMIRELSERLLLERPRMAPLKVWQAYAELESASGSPKNELAALVSLVRRVAGIDSELTSYDKTVDRNFQRWVFRQQAGTVKFTEAQMQWLRLIKDHIAASFHLETEDLDYTPFDALGGRGRMWQLFGAEMEGIIGELNEALAA